MRLTGYKHAGRANPCKPTHATKRAYTCESQPNNSGHCNEYSCTGAMCRDCIQSNRHSKHSRTGDEQPIEAESRSQKLATDRAEHDSTSIINAIDLRMVEFEGANDISSPSSDSGNEQKEDYAWNQA
jgi:hypothetical protein